MNVKRITYSEGDDSTPCWTRDDKFLVFTSGRGDNYDIYLKPINTSDVTNLTNNSSNDFVPSTSKIENKIAFLSDRESVVNLYSMDYDGKNVTNLTTNLKSSKINTDGFKSSGLWAYQTSWSPNGNYIVFNIMIGSNLELFTITKDGTNLTKITHNKDSDLCPVWVD